MKRLLCLILCFVIFLFGCRTTATLPQKADLPFNVPQQFSSAVAADEQLACQWNYFDNSELQALVEQALSGNADLWIIKARVDQAQAALKKEAAGFWPTLNYSAGGQKKGTWVKKNHDSSRNYDGSHSWDASLSGSWSPDIWGEQQAGRRSKESVLAAVGQDLREAEHETILKISEYWIDMIATRNKLAVLKKQITVNQAQLELQKFRYANGKASALDVSQQTEALAQIRAQKPLLERKKKELLHAISLLTANPAPNPGIVRTEQLPEIDKIPGLGVPADLLENRPDIRAGQHRLMSYQWEVEAAKADLLPSFSLTARALFSSGRLDLLFQNWIGTLTAALTGPLFDAGLQKAEIERMKAVVKEQTAAYAKLVLQALYEVEDLLAADETQKEYIRLLKEEQEIARLTLKDAQIQYRNGKSTYLSYLTILNTTEQLERQLIDEKATALKIRARIYRALGFYEFGHTAKVDLTE